MKLIKDVELSFPVARTTQEKFQSHFPHLVKKLENQSNVDWHAEFNKACRVEYKDLTPDQQGLFSLVKDGNVQTLKAKKIKFEDLILIDSRKKSLFDWANTSQNVCNLYSLAFEYYQNHDTDKQGRILLHWAVIFNQKNEIDRLANEKNINKLTDVYEYHGLKYGMTPLHYAAASGNVPVMKQLLEKKALIDHWQGYRVTPLQLAAANGHIEAATTLLDAGAYINGGLDWSGDSPLIAAASNNDIEMVDFLLNREAQTDAQCQTYKFSALYVACASGYYEIAELLLKTGADVNRIVGGDCLRPLQRAAENGHLNIVNLLLQYDVNVKASSPGSPYIAQLIAEENGHSQIADLLRRRHFKNIFNSGMQEARSYYSQALLRNDDDYFHKYSLFGFEINLSLFAGGYSAGRKKVAMDALIKVCEGADPATLTQHKDVLNQGATKEIYKKLKRAGFTDPEPDNSLEKTGLVI